jgi:hypothetical protein
MHLLQTILCVQELLVTETSSCSLVCSLWDAPHHFQSIHLLFLETGRQTVLWGDPSHQGSRPRFAVTLGRAPRTDSCRGGGGACREGGGRAPTLRGAEGGDAAVDDRLRRSLLWAHSGILRQGGARYA